MSSAELSTKNRESSVQKCFVPIVEVDWIFSKMLADSSRTYYSTSSHGNSREYVFPY